MASQYKIFYACSEMHPYAKVGGLGDVSGALPLALAKLGCDVRVILPLYGSIDRKEHAIRRMGTVEPFDVSLAEQTFTAELYSTTIKDSGVRVYFVGNEQLFDRPGIYTDPETGEGFEDNTERFLFFQKAVMGLLRRISWKPDVLHCNDHHTSLLPYYAKNDPDCRVATVFSIHNLAYQGITDVRYLAAADIPADQFFPLSAFEFFGDINMMKAGLMFADILTTVSPSYAREIMSRPEYGYGLEGVLMQRSEDLYGVLNGVNYAEWNPASDPLIHSRYSSATIVRKGDNKQPLREEFGLSDADENTPLLGLVGRLVEQKGVDILIEAAGELMEMDIQIAVLGTGRREFEEQLKILAKQYTGRFGVRLEYSNRLAHLVEAGSDMFLMPSRYEPCGLNQMYSLRYGSIPIVRATGGLLDSVDDYNGGNENGTGFHFWQYSAEALVQAVRRACEVWSDKKAWTAMMKRAMKRDFSWEKSAARYIELYDLAVGKAIE